MASNRGARNMKHNSHLTAIARKTLPVPTRWLLQHGMLTGSVMDYGCGKCASVNPPGWFNYDPYYQPNANFGTDRFDTIVCNYVLCTLPNRERMDVLKHIQTLLRLNGVAYISVRNDRPKQGWGISSRGTYQGRVRKLPLPILRNVKQYRIYLLTKETKLV